MVRKFGLALLALLSGSFALSSFADDEKKKDDKKSDAASIEDIMNAVPGKKGLVAKLSAAAKEGKWEDAAKYGTELKKFGGDLGKNDPPKGEKDSWAKLSKAFDETMTAMAKGAEEKDAKAITTAATAFGKSCKTCHDAHQKK